MPSVIAMYVGKLLQLLFGSHSRTADEMDEQDERVRVDFSRFWVWFEANNSSISESMKSDDEDAIRQAIDEVNAEIQKVTPGVSFLYGQANGLNEFVATANGMPERIRLVRALIESAPRIDTWRFTAFRPPTTGTPRIKLGELMLSVSDVTFQGFNLRERGLGITLYPTGMTEERRELYERATITLMDHVVGEFDAMVKIGSLRVDPPSDMPPNTEASPLSELRGFLDEVVVLE